MRSLKALVFGLVITLMATVTAQPIVITEWNFLSGGDGVRWEQLVGQFNASQDRIRVESTTSEWGVPFYTKVRTAIVAGQQPDVMTYHLSRFPSTVPQGLLRPISDEELASVGLSRDDFFPLLVEKATYEGQLYGVPLDTHPLVLFYNKDLLEQAGLLGEDGRPQGIDSIEGLTAAFRQAKEATGQYGVVFQTGGSTPWRIWLSLIAQQNGQVFDGQELAFGEEGRNALEIMANWTEEELAPRNVETGGASTAFFTGGRAAFMFNGVWNVTPLEDASASGELPFEYGVMPLPQFFENQSTWADSHALVIPTSPRSAISDEKVQAVLEFIAFVQENSLLWASGGHIPAYLPVVNSDEYRAMEPNADYAEAAEHVVYDPDVIIAGAAGPLQQATTEYFAPVLNGQLSVDQALEMFRQEVEQLMQNPQN